MIRRFLSICLILLLCFGTPATFRYAYSVIKHRFFATPKVASPRIVPPPTTMPPSVVAPAAPAAPVTENTPTESVVPDHVPGVEPAPLLTPVRKFAPGTTRASLLNGCAYGVGNLMHMTDYLRENPGSRTSILMYIKMDSEEASGVIPSLRTHAAMQEAAGRDFWPQLPLETRGLSLKAFREELARPGSQVEQSVRTLAREIARYRDRNKWYFIRPFCEMNDGTEENPWEFANPYNHNTPADLADAWKLLRETFDQEGATNALFVFSPLAAHSVHGEKEVLEALNLIPAGDIDAFGLNVYARPMTAYRNGKGSREPIPFAQLAQPWLDVLAHSKHRGIPVGVPEMGVSNQASDADRAQWLNDAFRFARAHHFVMMTYFNYPHRYWQIDPQTLAGDALQREINAAD